MDNVILTVNERRILFEWLKKGHASKITFKIKLFKIVRGHRILVWETRTKAYDFQDAMKTISKGSIPFIYSGILITLS